MYHDLENMQKYTPEIAYIYKVQDIYETEQYKKGYYRYLEMLSEDQYYNRLTFDAFKREYEFFLFSNHDDSSLENFIIKMHGYENQYTEEQLFELEAMNEEDKINDEWYMDELEYRHAVIG